MRADLSFVIPAYNAQKYLAEAVESCINQTYKNVEVVIVNDGSNDTTREIIEYYSDKYENVNGIKMHHNVGRSNARNIGIDSALGDIILAMDADDISTPSRAKTTRNYFKKQKGVDIMYGDFQVIDQLTRITSKIECSPFDWERLRRDKLAYIGHSTMAFRKKVFNKVRYTDGEYSKHAIDDWKFQVDAYKAGFKFGYVNKTLAQYRHYYEKERDELKIAELKEICLV